MASRKHTPLGKGPSRLAILVLFYPVFIWLTSHCIPGKRAQALGAAVYWLLFFLLSQADMRAQCGLRRPKRTGLLLAPAVILPAFNLLCAGHMADVCASPLRMLVLAGGVIWEELFFRGVMLNRLLKAHAPLAAILTQSLLFGLLHLVNLETGSLPLYVLVQCVTAVGTGFWLGTLAWQSQSTLGCILVHACINLSSPAMSPGAGESGMTAWQALGFLAIGALYFTIGLSFIRKQMVSEEKIS